MLGLLKDAFKDFMDDDCPVRAAALAYYTVFALPPLLILLMLVAGLVWDPADVQRALEGQFASLIGAEGAGAIREMLTRADRPGSGVAAILGVAGLIFGATGAFLQLQGALNHAWNVKPDPKQGGIRNFIGKRILSLGMVLGVGFLLVVSLAVSAVISALGESLGSAVPEPLLLGANFLVSFVVIAALFAAMFKFLPDAEVRWRDVLVGGVFTAALFVLGKLLIGLYLGRSEPGSAYGAASALAVILVWIYYAAMIVLFGAELTQIWTQRRGGGIKPEKGASLRS